MNIKSNLNLLFQAESTQYRLAKEVRSCDRKHDPEAIIMAASQIFRGDGFNDAAKVVSALQEEPFWNPYF